MFALHLVYRPRINLSLQEFMHAFNNHCLSTGRAWTPNQIWVHGMMDQRNPLRIHGGNSRDDAPSTLNIMEKILKAPFLLATGITM